MLSKSDSMQNMEDYKWALESWKGSLCQFRYRRVDWFLIIIIEKNVSSASDIAEELNNSDFVTIGPNLANEISDVPISFKQYLGWKEW